MSLLVESIGADGDGVAHLDGERVYVPYTAPGDTILAELRGARGALLCVEAAGPDRVAAPCPHFGECGGCALQHVSRSFQSAWKRERVNAALAREGVRAEAQPTVEIAAASRRRATFAVETLGAARLGFNARKSSRLVDIAQCAVLEPAFAARLAGLRALAAALPGRRFDLAVTSCENGLDVAAVGCGEIAGPALARAAALMAAAGAVRLTVDGAPAAVRAAPVIDMSGFAVFPPPGAFLQASRAGEAALVERVVRTLDGRRRIVDLFSGVGAFALPLSREAAVSAFDIDQPAIDALRRAGADAQRAGGRRVDAQRRDLFERPLSAGELKAFDAAVIDPPRAGAQAQCAALAASGVGVIAYVSCNPATFARDAAILIAGGYALADVVPVDQFAYSAHVELVGAFRR